MIMGREAQMGLVANVVVGIIGALIGGFLIGLLFEVDVQAFSLPGLLVALVEAARSGGWLPPGEFSLRGLLVALVGAVILLAILGALRRSA